MGSVTYGICLMCAAAGVLLGTDTLFGDREKIIAALIAGAVGAIIVVVASI